MTKIAQWIRGHFRRLERHPKWTFFWRTWLEAVVIAYAVGNLAQAILRAAPRDDLAGLGTWHLCILVLGVGPLLETLAFQCLPLEITTAAGARRMIRLASGIVPFALLHWFAGLPTVFSAGFVGGFYFSFTYDRWRRESLVVAVAMTFLLHATFNLVGALALILSR